MARSIQKFACISLIPIIAGGCIKEDMSNCPPSEMQTTEVLVVRVTDILSGEDITDSGQVIDASLMVFDADRSFIERIDISGEQIGGEIEVPVSAATRAAGNELYISAWGNILGNIDIQENIGADADIDSQFLNLKANTSHSGYLMCPGEMFFGLKKITLGQSDTRAAAKITHVVPITQKNARLMITVRGLPTDFGSEDYYFKLCQQNDGYTFYGTPIADDRCDIRETGIFTDTHDFISPQPYYLIPSLDPDNVDEESCAVIHLFRTASTRADEDIDLSGQVTRDIYGNHIALYAGQTTNVLITFTDKGDIEVRMAITPWNVVHQWSNW